MMKISPVFAVLFCLYAHADHSLPPHKLVTAQHAAGGVGSDFTAVQLMATQQQFDNGYFYITYNQTSQRLTAQRLPVFRAVYKCEFHRASGGSIGDYKPKSIYAAVNVGPIAYDHLGALWVENLFGRDYNDDPVVIDHVFEGWTFGEPGTYAKRAMNEACSQPVRPGSPHHVTMRWVVHGACRWKPENWFKPGNFPFEYDLPWNTDYTATIRLNCEN